MAYLDINAFKKLKAFFWGLQASGFDLNKIPARDLDGTLIDKPYCLNLLHSFPEFQDERFKDDNFLVKHLANPNNFKQILDQFTLSQQMELAKIMKEQPIATQVSEDAVSQPVATGVTTAESPSTMTGGSLPQIPNFRPGSASYSVPRVPNTPNKLTGGKEGGTGTGTAATNKISSRSTFQIPKMSPTATTIVKNASSGSQIFIKKSLGSIGRSLGEIAGGVGKGIGGPMLNSSYRGLGRFGNGAINSFARLSNTGGRLRSRASSFRPTGSKKLLWGLLGAFFIFFFLTAITGSPTGTTSPGSAGPVGPGGGASTTKMSIGVNIHYLVNKEPARINRILSYLSNSCGVSLVRIWGTGSAAELKETLDLGSKYNVKFIIALADFANRTPADTLIPLQGGDNLAAENPTGWYRDGYKGNYRSHVRDTVTFLKDHPAIYAWELANEPHCAGFSDCPEAYTNWVKDVSGLIKNIDANHLVSVGTQANAEFQLGDSVADGQFEKINSISTIGALTGHYYDGSKDAVKSGADDFKTQKDLMLKEIAIAKKLNKPFYVGEAGFLCQEGQVNCTLASDSSQDQRAQDFKKELDDIFKAGAAGYLVWQYSDRKTDTTENDPFSFFEGDPICSVLKEASQKVISGPTGSSDIRSCQFTRGGNTPKEASFVSKDLLNYIQEASSKSSIPPAVFAAFIRVESPATSGMSDSQIANYSANCAQSGTGALGIMQIQPPGTTSARGDPASCDDCIDAGAKLVGKTVATLTKADYCDPRTNIIVGAGWILKKMSKLGYGDGTAWNPDWTDDKEAIKALVNTYYGCFNYGGARDCTGPYNYADDVWTSVQSCKPSPVPQEKLDKILYWAKMINDNLEFGNPSTSYNKMVQNITSGSYSATTRTAQNRGVGPDGIYWCTNIVIDSYNLSSITGLGSSHQGVRNMLDFWKNTSGYTFIPFTGIDSLRQAKPGYALFRIYAPDYNWDHVSIIKTIIVDERGNGKIETYDSNSVKGWWSTIENGIILSDNFRFLYSNIVGFGGIQ